MARLRTVGVAAALTLALVLALTAVAQATTYTVNTTADNNAAGGCAGVPGDCSIRQALAKSADGDMISIPGGHDTLTHGVLTVAHNVTISGAGAANTTVDGAGASRVFDVTGAGPVHFQNFTITGGSVDVSGTANDGGAGIYDPGGQGLVLANMAIVNNAVTSSGGAGNQGGGGVFEDGGPLTDTGSTFSGDKVTFTGTGPNGNSGGGGLYSDGGGMTLTNTVVTGDTVTGPVTGFRNGGGGAYSYADGQSTLTNATVTLNNVSLTGAPVDQNGGGGYYSGGEPFTITGGSFSGNSLSVAAPSDTNGGGGVYGDEGNMTVSGAQINHNTATITGTSNGNNGGGGLYNDGSGLTITGSAIDSNTLMGTGTTNNGGGGFYNDGNSVSLTGSTVASNSATLTGTTDTNGGGGFYNDGNSLTVLNATIAGNTLSEPAGNADGGGGIYDDGNASTLTFTTLAGNTSNQPGGGISDNGGATTFKDTIIAGNVDAGGTNNCVTTGSAFATAGNNLEDSTPTQCGLSAAQGDLIGVGAGLGVLQDNGGGLPTMELLAGSPAIDHIPPAACTDQSTPTALAVTTDERGVARPYGAGCDVGAYELAPADLALSATASPTTVALGGRSTLTFGLSNAGPTYATLSTLKVTLPAGLTLVSATPSQGTCTAAASVVTCALGTIVNGAGAQVSLVVAGAAAGAHTVSATAGSNEPDPTPADNGKNVAVTVFGPSVVQPGPVKPAQQVSAALACTSAPIVLIDVSPSGKHVVISGAARLNLAGRSVAIELLANRKTVATTKIAANGTFSTTAPLPPKRFRTTNAARYEAVVGTTHSSALKLFRRMYMTSAAESAGKVHLAGHVTGAFKRGTKVTLTLRVTCTTTRVVAKPKLTKRGTYSATVAAPTGTAAQVAVYRASTTVLKNGHREPTFTLPRPPAT